VCSSLALQHLRQAARPLFGYDPSESSMSCCVAFSKSSTTEGNGKNPRAVVSKTIKL
jgi:hypothetical protein